MSLRSPVRNIVRVHKGRTGNTWSVPVVRSVSALLLFVLLLPAQRRTVANAATEYTDAFRQTSSSSRSLVFGSSSSVSLRSLGPADTVAISVRSNRVYLSTDQRITRFTGSFRSRLAEISASYASSVSVVTYALHAGAATANSDLSAIGGFSGTIDPWNGTLAADLSAERRLTAPGLSAAFLDFLVPIEHAVPTVAGTATLRGTIGKHYSLFVTAGKKNTERTAGTVNDDLTTTWNGTELGAGAEWTGTEGEKIHAAYNEERNSGYLRLTRTGVSFADLDDGILLHRSAQLGGSTTIFSLPVSTGYAFHSWSGTAVGDVQSWPFTTLAASIVTNRLYYRASGSAVLQSLRVATDIRSESMDLHPSLTYAFLRTDAAVNYWEPELLVFGRKNEGTAAIPIRRAHILGIGLAAQIPWGRSLITLAIDQLIPLSITYAPRTSVANGGTPDPAANNSTINTDGGRRLGITISSEL